MLRRFRIGRHVGIGALGIAAGCALQIVVAAPGCGGDSSSSSSDCCSQTCANGKCQP